MKTLFFLLLVSINCTAQVMWQVQTNGNKKWYLQFHDEFINSDTTFKHWKSGFPWSPHVMGLDLIYKTDNLNFKDGVLTISTKKEQTTSKVYDWDIDKKYLASSNKVLGPNNEYTFDYSSGAITTMRAFKYGYFECRFIANNEQGTWPAFWLYGGNPNEEIDFYEGKGEKDNQMHLDVHCPKGCADYRGGFLNLKKNWGAWVKSNESLANGWNIISGEWQPNYVKFYLNGQPMAYFEGEFKTAQQLFLNTSVAKDGGAFSPGPKKNATWPDEFKIDYVRVWGDNDSLMKNQQPHFSEFNNTEQSIENNKLYTTSLKSKVGFVYNKKVLNSELGTITLLPISRSKYSVSILGAQLNSELLIELFNQKNELVFQKKLNNSEYEILNFESIKTGDYKIELSILGQKLKHDITIFNLIK